MSPEAKQLTDRFHQLFNQHRNNQYWIVIVDNHFNDKYSFFLYRRELHHRMRRSFLLTELSPRDAAKYALILAQLKSISKISIKKIRTTRNLEITYDSTNTNIDLVHGHGPITTYMRHTKSNKSPE